MVPQSRNSLSSSPSLPTYWLPSTTPATMTAVTMPSGAYVRTGNCLASSSSEERVEQHEQDHGDRAHGEAAWAM